MARTVTNDDLIEYTELVLSRLLNNPESTSEEIAQEEKMLKIFKDRRRDMAIAELFLLPLAALAAVTN